MAKKKSITETGPKALRGIRNPDLYIDNENPISQSMSDMDKQLLQDEANRAIHRGYRVAKGHIGYEGLSDPSLYEPQSTDLEYGSSTYDNGLLLNPTQDDINNQRALAQSSIAKVSAGIGKGAVLAGTTFLNGTVGLVYGLASMPTQGFSGLWDNDFSRALDDINKKAEELMPNYYSTEELNQPWYKNINANFLGDKLLKNIGFSIGAMYSGGAWTKALTMGGKLSSLIGLVSKSTKAPAITNMVIGSAFSAVSEGSIEAMHKADEWTEDEKARAYVEHQEELNKIYNEYLKEKAIQDANPKIEDAYAEIPSGDMALLNYKAKIQNAENAYNSRLNKIQEDRAKVGNATLLMNVAVLTASNLFTLGKYYAGGYNNARRASNVSKRITNEGGKYALKSSKGDLAKTVLKAPLAEGTEEITQRAVGDIAGDYYTTDVNNYYKSKIDPNAEQETLDMMKSFAKGISKTVGDISAWEEFAIGALTGVLGIPSFRKIKSKDGKIQSPIVMQEGIINELRERSSETKRANELINYMNDRITDSGFLEYYQGLIRHNKYQGIMDKSSEEGDEFSYRNAEHSQLISDIRVFDEAGKLEDFKGLVSQVFDTSDANLDAIIRNTTSATESGELVGPFSDFATIDLSGNIVSVINDSNKQKIIDELTKNKDNLLKNIESYQKIKDNLEIKFGDRLTDNQKEELIWIKSQQENWSNRANKIIEDVKPSLNKVLEVLNSEITKHSEDKDYSETLKEYSNFIGIATKSPELANLFLTKNPEFIEDLIKLSKDSEALNLDELQDIVTKLNDLHKIVNAYNSFNEKLSEYLDNPNHIDEEQNKIKEEVAKEALQNEANKAIDNLKEQETSTLQSLLDKLNENDDDVNKEVESIVGESNDDLLKNKIKQSKDYKDFRKAFDSIVEEEKLNENIKNILEQFIDEALNNTTTFDDFLKFTPSIPTDVLESDYLKAKYIFDKIKDKVNNRKSLLDVLKDSVELNKSTPDSTPEVTENLNEKPSESPIGDITKDDNKKDNIQISNETSDSPKIINNGDTHTYYRPVIPQFHIDSSKLGVLIPFNIAIKEASKGKLNFDEIYKFLEDKGAFDYVNQGKLKVNDEIYFTILDEFEELVKDKEWHKEPTIFMITKDGQIVGSLDENPKSTKRYRNLESLKAKIHSEYKSFKNKNPEDSYTSTIHTKVSKIMLGRLKFTETENDLVDVLPESFTPKFAIVKNGVIHTNGEIEDSLIRKPRALREGALYLLVPNSAGTYSIASVRTKNLYQLLHSPEGIPQDINSELQRVFNILFNADNEETFNSNVGQLANTIYIGNLHIDANFSNDSVSKIIIKKPILNSKGEEKYIEKDGKRYREEETITITKSNINNVGELLAELKPLMQVKAKEINSPNYQKYLINNRIITSNLESPTMVGSWFITDYIDDSGNVKSPEIPIPWTRDGRIQTPLGAIESKTYNVELNNSTYKVDIENRKVYKVLDNNEVQELDEFDSNFLLIYNLAWADSIYGDIKNSTNQYQGLVLIKNTSNEFILDRINKKIITDSKLIEELKERLKGVTKGVKNNTNTTNSVVESTLQEIEENNKKVIKNETTGEFYKILLPDGTIGDFKRVTTVIGSNWQGESKKSQASERALKVGSAIDTIVRDFFNSDGKKVSKPKFMTQDAFNGFLSILNSINEDIKSKGLTFHTNNIVLFHEYTNGERVAGEVDILVTDNDGNFYIYDVKTSKRPIINKDGSESKLFTEPQGRQKHSTKVQYQRQLSSYATLLENQYGIKIKGLAIVPFHVTYTQNDDTIISNVSSNSRWKIDVDRIDITEVPLETKDNNGQVSSREIEVDNISIPKGENITNLNSDLSNSPASNPLNFFSNENANNPNSFTTPDITFSNPNSESIISEFSGYTNPLDLLQNGKKDEKPKNSKLSRATKRLKREDDLPEDLFRVVDNERELWDSKKELRWLNRVLPQLSREDRLKVIEGLIEVAQYNGYAWGKFSEGIITLSDISAIGTTYHEAFHVVFNMLLNNSQRESLLGEAKSMYGNLSNLELEEYLAESFREYVMKKESKTLLDKVKDFFKSLYIKVTNWNRVLPYTDRLYKDINSGKYANKPFINDYNKSKSYTLFENLDTEIQDSLIKEGWSKELFNSISQEEKEKTLECIGI